MEGGQHKCKYISSFGLMYSCDIIIAKEMNSKICIEEHNFTGLGDGMKLYVNSNLILDFLLQMHKIPYKFILVSGNSDTSITYELFVNNDIFNTFINNKKIIHWFTQNCLITDHPKISQIPIGLDYHTITHTKCIIGDITSSKEQESQLNSIKCNAKPFWEREKIAFSNFHFSLTVNYTYLDINNNSYIEKKEIIERYQAIQNIPRELIYYQTSPMNRKDSWNECIKYAFIVSPPGNGLDCHRTWECLCLGNIVIVKSSPLDSLFEDLPVLVVKEWTDITRELLEITIIEYRYRKFNYEKLTLQYWVDKWKEYV
jgi:hypothetical protein